MKVTAVRRTASSFSLSNPEDEFYLIEINHSSTQEKQIFIISVHHCISFRLGRLLTSRQVRTFEKSFWFRETHNLWQNSLSLDKVELSGPTKLVSGRECDLNNDD